MITAEELVLELNNEEESKNFKLATVVDLFTNETAKLQFDGEDVASEKEYAYLKSYIPEINDRILLAALGGTYIILGKVNYNESPDTGVEEIDRYIFDLKTVNILKGLMVADGLGTDTLTVDNGATIVGNVGIDGSVTAISFSATGNITASGALTGTSLDVGSGAISGGAGTFSSINTTGSGTIRGTFQHYGGSLGFFSRGATNQRRVPLHNTTPDLNNLKTKVNDIINALSAYGLIST